MIYYL
ncbi:hypothetical protein FOXB_04787 [Fusarium oxysporum f. sp. conglutinans Fo5176]